MNLVHKIPYQIPIKEILVEKGIARKLSELTSGYDKIHVICDENTEAYVKSGLPKTVLPRTQKPTLSASEIISKIETNLFVAFGSGTINDIVKYASFLAGKPYIVFATAPSMNGYASGNASLINGKYKKSFSAAPPVAIYADLEILENAPRRLINAGIGDTICQPTIEADLLLSNQALDTPLYSEYFSALNRADYFDNIEALTTTLIYSGIIMYLAGSSAPASQGEHMIAHLMEMAFPNAPHTFHGEQIAVTTLTMMEIIGNLESREFTPESFPEILPPTLQDQQGYFRAQYSAKLSKLKKFYFDKKNFEKFYQTKAELEKKLKAIGAPTKPADLGWDESQYAQLLPLAKFTRDRFTVLDLL